MHKFFDLTKLALEDATPVEQMETEIVIYAKIGEPDRLQECKSKEDHIQLETTFENGTRCRVREVRKEGKSEYFFTFKVATKTDNGTDIDANREFTAPVDEAFFKGFHLVTSRKLVKTRYIFASENVTLNLKEGSEDRPIVIPNIEYEVDVYTKEDGTISEWCKIDVEVDSIINYVNNNHKELNGLKLNVKVSHLPFAPSSSILGTNATDEQRIKIDEIWEEFTQKT